MQNLKEILALFLLGEYGEEMSKEDEDNLIDILETFINTKFDMFEYRIAENKDNNLIVYENTIKTFEDLVLALNEAKDYYFSWEYGYQTYDDPFCIGVYSEENYPYYEKVNKFEDALDDVKRYMNLELKIA